MRNVGIKWKIRVQHRRGLLQALEMNLFQSLVPAERIQDFLWKGNENFTWRRIRERSPELTDPRIERLQELLAARPRSLLIPWGLEWIPVAFTAQKWMLPVFMEWRESGKEFECGTPEGRKQSRMNWGSQMEPPRSQQD